MKRSIWIVFCMVMVVFCSTKAQGFQNPVIPGFYPDPSVCRVGDDYYLVTSSFEYFPGIPVFHSKDLIHWEQIGHCLTRPSQLNLDKCNPSSGLWAATIRYHEGVFYMINTNTAGGGHFFVTAHDPAGEWSEPVWIDQKGIDPSLFWDDDGSAWLTTNTNEGAHDAIILRKIDLKTGKLLTDPVLIWAGTGGWYPEGSHIYKKDGWYYLLIAEGGVRQAHSSTIARSKNLTGPYEGCPSNPILTHNRSLAERNIIQGVGHGDFVEAPDGSWWMVFLGHRQQNNHFPLGRETFLAPVIWPKEGWPVINGGNPITSEMDGRTLPQQAGKEKPVRDDFANEKPGFEWNYLRTPVFENYSLSARKGFLTLTGAAVSLDDKDTPTFLGRRQQHFDFTATTQMEFSPAAANETAGLTVYMNNRYHYDLYLQKGNKLVLRYKVGNIHHLEKEVKVNGTQLQLRVSGTPETYIFSFSDDQGKTFHPLGTIDTHLLSPLTAGGFTGVYIGMFASGNGKPSRSKACFDWFDYRGN
ncbi:MAG: glycoside hydrolase family 43 protein [Dysgonamonadaceae bacterium]|nr:glycoside hydrolase family 43 protein [Dysgonamonadaceae bacterium]